MEGVIMNKIKSTVLLICLIMLLSTAMVIGQIPQHLNYQCVLTDTTGAPLSGTFSVQFAIYDAPSGGATLWTETQSVAADNGFCNVLLGSVTPIPLNLFDASPRFLGVAVEADPEMTPRQNFSSVGYAFSSHSANQAAGNWSVPGDMTVSGISQFNGFTGMQYGVPYELLIMAGTDSADAAVLKIGHDNGFNNQYSGKIVFEEDMSFSNDYCGIAMQYDGSTNDLLFMGGCTVPDTIMILDRGGNVAIGAPVSSNILTIQQNAANDPIADAWTQYSSARWKTNVETIDSPLEKVKQLRGVYYKEKKNSPSNRGGFNEDGQDNSLNSDLIETNRKLGVIAEEVGKVLPEIVTYEANGVDARSVDYSRIVALLIEAVKEQQKEIDNLKQIINNK
jgi:hypothetical protein